MGVGAGGNDGGQNYVEFLAWKQSKNKRYYPWVEGYAETK
jgi:hypothetical protein